jgi:hypothetical protein
MEKRTFYGFRFGHLSNDNAYSLIKSTIEVAIPVRTLLGEMGNAVLSQLMVNADKFGQQVTVLHKSKLTGQVTALDEKDDDLLAEIKRGVVFMIKSRDLYKQSAAQELDFFFTPYWGAGKKPVKAQVDDLAVMFTKFHADPKLLTAASICGVLDMITELEATNIELGNKFLERNEEHGNRPESGSDLRPAAAESYAQFCTVVEQAVNFTPNDELIKLFNNMDELRRRYSLLASDNKDKPTDTPKA